MKDLHELSAVVYFGTKIFRVTINFQPSSKLFQLINIFAGVWKFYFGFDFQSGGKNIHVFEEAFCLTFVKTNILIKAIFKCCATTEL